MRKQPYPVTNLTGGLNVAVDPAFLQDADSPDVREVLYKNGILTKESGKITFGHVVLGTPMHIRNFVRSDGTSSLLLFTTTTAYVWNTTTLEWEDITLGVTVEDCEDVWDDQANVTSSVSTTDFKRGTKSLLLTVASGFTTGLIATEAISSANYTAYTHIHLWLKSSVNVTSGQLQLMLDDTATCASPQETINIPALVAGVWTHVSLPIATPASLTAVISVGFNATADLGAFTLAVDDIRAVKQFTGTISNRFCSTTLNDTFIVVNGIDAIYKYTTGTSLAALGGSPPTYAKCICTFQNRILLGGTYESGALPYRVRWSSIGTTETWTGGTSGYLDMLDTPGFVTNLMLLTGKCILYKDDSIWDFTYIGGTSVFEPILRVSLHGTTAPSSIVDQGLFHILYTDSDVVTFDGTQCTPIEAKIFPLLYRTGEKLIDLSAVQTANGLYVQETKTYLLCFPNESLLLKYSFETNSWIRFDNCAIYAMGHYKKVDTSPTWTAVTGTWSTRIGSWGRLDLPVNAPTVLLGFSDSQVYEDDRVSSSTNELIYITKDFVFSHAHRFREVRIVYRYGGCTLYYSTDGGLSYTSLGTFTYRADWVEAAKALDLLTKRIRFKLTTSEVAFELKWIEPWYVPRARSYDLKRS